MKRLTVIIPIMLLAAILVQCRKAGSAVVEPEKVNSSFTEIDTSLKITAVREGDITIYKVDKYETVIVKIPRISSYMLFPQPTRSLQQIAADSNFSLVVNASYFDFVSADTNAHIEAHFLHAGYLRINDKLYENIKDERQATRLLAYNSRQNRADFYSLNDLDKTGSYDLVVQVGPQIIRENEIDSMAINNSVNGMMYWPRTVFAVVNNVEFYVIVNLSNSYVSLLDLAKMLRSTGIFKKNLNIINFDGGFSTCLYIKNHPEFCTNQNNKMPLMIGVR